MFGSAECSLAEHLATPQDDRMSEERGRLRELAALFLRLGFTAFGGPAAHVALLHDEVVRRRSWVSEQHFLDLVGATNLVPGPNSTELAIHLGYQRARWRGLLVAGCCFIAPAALMVGVLAWAYLRYGQTPVVVDLLGGVTPVVVAIIAYALAGLARTAIKTVATGLIAAAALCAYLFGLSELLLLAAGGAAGVAVWSWPASPPGGGRGRAVAPWWLGVPALKAAGGPLLVDPGWAQLTRLFLTMLKIGSVLFGSGYVLLAFLRGDFVDRLGWLTDQQLLDAVAIGQLTPGPLFTTATFVGYLVAGVPGAVLATIGIFLPAFVFARFLGALVRWIRARGWAGAALDGINATALALMAGVAIQLGRAALADPISIGLALISFVVLWRWRLNSAWLIAAGALVGLVRVLL